MSKIEKNKLNIKILIWIALLVFSSGYANCITILYCSIPVTHFTGNITNLAISFINRDINTIYSILFAVFSFFIGGVFCGFIFYKKHIGFSKVFGISLISCGFFYIILNIFFLNKLSIIIVSTAFISGVQNALLLRYKNITTRTTHITGYLTDCSVNLGRALKGDKMAFKLFLFFFLNIIIFLLGAILGVYFIEKLNLRSFFIIGFLQILAGIFYLYFINNKDIGEEILKNS